ncbi:alpha/beta fold hydrolase [Larkinella insperata]|uniref:Alpha/beta fold hydrolase n=1 Tax=Larkinella insperata TaxID=332158 RepID=A0ABW3QH57_9BACT
MSAITHHVLFLQGGAGLKDHQADQVLVDSLQGGLGKAYRVHYPLLPDEPSPDLGRIRQIDQEISRLQGELVVVGHSLGASMLLKYVSENPDKIKLKALFLLATPFWQGDEKWKQAFKLPEDFADQLPQDLPLYFYHCRDDQEVPFAHLALYGQKLPWATFHPLASGGHHLNDDLRAVADAIKSL